MSVLVVPYMWQTHGIVMITSTDDGHRCMLLITFVYCFLLRRLVRCFMHTKITWYDTTQTLCARPAHLAVMLTATAHSIAAKPSHVTLGVITPCCWLIRVTSGSDNPFFEFSSAGNA